MRTPLSIREPFSFDQTVAFVRQFPPCQGEYIVDEDALTAAIAVDDRPVVMTIQRTGTQLAVETARAADLPAALAHARHWIGADDDVAALYRAARGDAAFSRLIEQLHGLHHVRFLTLAEISVYCVMTQRAPITMASRMKRAFLAAFGLPVEVAGRTLRAMPSLAALADLEGDAIGKVIGHAHKGSMIARAVRGVAAIGEVTLREAPYAEARDALLAIPGIGPFSAAMILLRGLGRMDEVPSVGMFADEAAQIYGGPIDEAAIARRYGSQIGYWSFYVKAGAGKSRRMRA